MNCNTTHYRANSSSVPGDPTDIAQQTERRIHQLRVTPSGHELRMHACLDAFVRVVQRERGARDPSTWLALSTLLKRALSSAFALRRSVERRLLALGAADEPHLEQLTLPLGDTSGELDVSDDVPVWTIPGLRSASEERVLLTRVADAARAASERETKLTVLARLLRRIAGSAIVFTEYRDTLLHVRETIAPDAAVIHGGLSRMERKAALARFAAGGVLLSTDAAGEGLNLQRNCRIVVNLELPWNPIRLEQRIGRVDRIGQQRRVHVFHLIAAATREVEIHRRLTARIARARSDVGGPDPLALARRRSSNFSPAVACHGLQAEAATEYTRLIEARRIGFCLNGDTPAPGQNHGRILINFSKRRTIRTRLGSQMLVVLLSYGSDGNGKIVATHLTPVLAQAIPAIRLLLERLSALGPAVQADSDYTRWLDETRAVHDAFWKMRIGREAEIARTRERVRDGLLQPGLFDLRAEQHRRIATDRRRHALLEDAEVAAFARRAASLTVHAPQPVLVLLP